MNLVQSISHPELLVSDCGAIYKDGQRLNHIQGHSLSIRGPIVAYWLNGKCKQISIIRLVYEAHVKKSKIESNDYIHALDGDEFNVKASNLVAGSRYSKPVAKKKVVVTNVESKPKESWSCWQNGVDELYC